MKHPFLAVVSHRDELREFIRHVLSLAGVAVCLAGIVPMSLAVPEQGFEPFQGINHVSSFSRSGVYALSQLLAHGWIDAAPSVSDPVT